MVDIEMLHKIKEYVNNRYGLDINKDTRKREYIDARTLYYKLCRDLTKCSLEAIGSSVGRDHAAVIHALKNTIHYIDKEEIVEGNLHFGNALNLPKQSTAYLVYKNNELKKELEKKDAVLRLLPQLEDIYNNLSNLTEEQKQKVNRRNEMEFDTIGKCLNRVEEKIKVEIE
ncbi:MAG: hypothetical protein GY820_17625 [Gammaproteobacteria bacterium]|nr:hypothetical protein [Gammaproteobacteria bacterium]